MGGLPKERAVAARLALEAVERRAEQLLQLLAPTRQSGRAAATGA